MLAIHKIKWKIAQSLEFKWWKRYLKNKQTDDYLSWKLSYWEDVLSSLNAYIPIPISNVILDAGCGPAGIFMALSKNQVDAIDPLLYKYEELTHFNKSRYVWVDFQNYALEDLHVTEKYDLIFCMNAINHVENMDRCYDNLIRALKPNGYIIISTDAHNHSILKKIFQLLPGDLLHPQQYNLKEYHLFLTKRNCKIVTDILLKKGTVFNYYITLAKK